MLLPFLFLALSLHSVTLTWQGPQVQYTVYRQHGANCAKPNPKWNLKGSANGMTWTDSTDLTPGQIYCYYVADSAGNSQPVTVVIPTP